MQSVRNAVSLTQILATLQLRHEGKHQTVVKTKTNFSLLAGSAGGTLTHAFPAALIT